MSQRRDNEGRMSAFMAETMPSPSPSPSPKWLLLVSLSFGRTGVRVEGAEVLLQAFRHSDSGPPRDTKECPSSTWTKKTSTGGRQKWPC